MKATLKIWNKTIFGDVHLKVENVIADVDAIQRQIASSGFSDELHEEEVKAQTILQEAISFEETFCK